MHAIRIPSAIAPGRIPARRADIHLEKSHVLSTTEVKSRVMALSSEIERRFGVKVKWQSDATSFVVNGFPVTIRWQGESATFKVGGVEGELINQPGKAAMDLNLNFVARLFRGKIESGVREALNTVLG